jgi:hypothetical protein
VIDTSKTYTVGGRPAVFVRRLSGDTEYPLVFICQHTSGDEYVETFAENGRVYRHEVNPDCDLIEVIPPKYKLVWNDGTTIPNGMAAWADRDELDAGYQGYDRAGWLVLQGDKVTWEPIKQ